MNMDKQTKEVMIGVAIFLWGIVALRIFIDIIELINAYKNGFGNYVGIDAVVEQLDWAVMWEVVFMWPLYVITIVYTIYMIIKFKKCKGM
ncbi:MAG: hypothetical protein VZR06_11360 [Butyrivibrio sp.]|uniref:hypothetical protein n=1 Tax=Butyrivibrio sp. LB2008 TaxID=1408305 RepID=UPI00047A9B5B|nr:hypothetical protein [Butyrivibrio sp. LB2008]MEE3495751.1 hypothetical protein [Butyrivibrio sp.]